MKIVQEHDVEEIELPGRFLKWLVSPKLMESKNLSVCIITIPGGQTVHPAHSHPNEEEVIYIISGRGRVMVDGEVEDVKEGTAVLFPPDSVHMLRNEGSDDMKVICFFSPPSDISSYKFFENITFPK